MNTAVDVSPTLDPLSVRMVLVETSHPGNIGAAARAMKTMAVDRLWLVNPSSFPSAEASARATGAADLLQRATVCSSLADAIAGCGYVVGASARQRSLPWPLLSPRECGSRVVREARSGEVAVVFGPEQSGLSNDDLALCHALVRIPTDPGFSSLNLAMAVQVIAYEIMVARGGPDGPESPRENPLATADEMQQFFDHLERVLVAAEFLDPRNPKHLMLRLRRLFARAEPDANEVAILRGILSAVAPGSGRAPAEEPESQ